MHYSLIVKVTSHRLESKVIVVVSPVAAETDVPQKLEEEKGRMRKERRPHSTSSQGCTKPSWHGHLPSGQSRGRDLWSHRTDSQQSWWKGISTALLAAATFWKEMPVDIEVAVFTIRTILYLSSYTSKVDKCIARYARAAESDRNSCSREFLWESAYFFLAQPWILFFLFLVLVSKHESDRQNFSFWSQKMRFSLAFLEKEKTYYSKKCWQINRLFLWKHYSIDKQKM